MKALRFDERNVVRETGGNFVVFVYEGGNELRTSWSVDSHLLTDADLPGVMRWLDEHLPTDCCWSRGVVVRPENPTPKSEVQVAWIVGSDVLNSDATQRGPHEKRLAEEMLVRRHRLTLL